MAAIEAKRGELRDSAEIRRKAVVRRSRDRAGRCQTEFGDDFAVLIEELFESLTRFCVKVQHARGGLSYDDSERAMRTDSDGSSAVGNTRT